jgi:hypothetical protein
MPIPPIDKHMERFAVGPITIGVEYRVISEDVVAASGVAKGPISVVGLNDKGVSIHIYLKTADGDRERLRFDCFEDDPHYHYVCWSAPWHDVVFFDEVSNGDLMVWSLNCIRTRLPQMLERAGIESATQYVDQRLLESVLPRVTECAYRSRFHSDSEHLTKATLALGKRVNVNA